LARTAVQSNIREAKRPLSSPNLVWSGPVVLTAPPGQPQLAAPLTCHLAFANHHPAVPLRSAASMASCIVKELRWQGAHNRGRQLRRPYSAVPGVNLRVKIALPPPSVTSIFQPLPGRSAPFISRSFSRQAVVASSHAASLSTSSSPSFVKGPSSGVELADDTEAKIEALKLAQSLRETRPPILLACTIQFRSRAKMALASA
jgi:hypothetical protein